MREHLLDLCLLAYPRARRAADRDFLRDLALDLAETQGFPRQAWSLLGGGLRERIQDRRRRAPVSVGGWAKRIVVGSSVLAAVAFAATGLIAPGSGSGGVSEVERLVCQYTEAPPSERHGVPINCRGELRKTERLIAACERAGSYVL
jgi:hypothetical protein